MAETVVAEVAAEAVTAGRKRVGFGSTILFCQKHRRVSSDWACTPAVRQTRSGKSHLTFDRPRGAAPVTSVVGFDPTFDYFGLFSEQSRQVFLHVVRSQAH